jgi:hypothetical protein
VKRWVNPHLSFWLTTLPETAALSLASALDYLFEHGRGAVLPDVRHRIQTSRHYPNMSEVRVSHGQAVFRILTCFVHDDQTLLVCVGGDKAGWARKKTTDWYDVYVPIADAVTDLYLQENP